MKAIVRYSDGLVQFFQVQEHESNNGTDIELPLILDIKRPNHGRTHVILNRILGTEWHELPEYVEKKKIS